MVVILYRWWAKGEKDQLGKPVARGSRTQGTSGADFGDFQEQVQQQLGTTLTAMVPTLIQGLTTWIAGGQQGPPPVPSFTASNSHNAQAAPLVSPAEAVFVSPAPAWALDLNAPGCTPVGTSPASGPSVSCTRTPAVGGASTLAELDGITVTKPLG